MGFHKRTIHKKDILENIGRTDVLFKADALIMDQWSTMFKKHLNEKDRKLIPEIYEKNKLLSYHTDDYKQLSSLSECLISLMTEPRWAPLIYTLERLKITVTDDERGRFPILKEKAIEGIIDYYDNIWRE
jgi:hypothetical protein